MLTVIVALLVSTVGIAVVPLGANAQQASVTRDLPDYAEPNEMFVVTLTQSGFFSFGSGGIGIVWEVLPEGFEYVNGSYIGGGDADWDSANRTLELQFLEDLSVTYGVNASSYIQTAEFSGTWRSLDPQLNITNGTVGGDVEVVVVVDGTPPGSITNLQYTNGTTWLKWTWTNPADSDFSHVLIYLNGTWRVNTTEEWYNATGLEPDTEYEIGTRTVDETGNVNGTWVNGTARTLPESDEEPPGSITNLQYTNGTTWLKWTWTNPGDADFSHVLVYLNGTWGVNTSVEFYNASGLEPDTEYELGTRTVDDTGNINGTWVNGTATTLPACIPPETSWNMTISATNQLEPVVVGMHPNATDDYDDAFDAYAQTPVQGKVISIIDAIYATSIKKTRCYNESVSWNLTVGVPSGQTTTLSWDVPADVNLIILEGDTVLPSGSELGEGSHELTVIAKLEEYIRFCMDLKAGWNMVSIPVIPDNNSVQAIFGSIPTLDTMPVVTWQSPSFVEVSEIEPKIGHWVFTPTATTICITGEPITNRTLNLKAGWNLAGTVGMDNLTISEIPSQVPQCPAVTWVAPSFVETDLIEPGESAWIFVTTDTIVTAGETFSTEIKTKVMPTITTRRWAATQATTEEWNLTLSATNQLEPVTFGLHSNATDGDDSEYDAFTQFPVQGKVILILDNIYAKEINRERMTWNLSVGVPTGEATTVTWNSSEIPSDINLTLDGTDMKLQNSLPLGEGSHSFAISGSSLDDTTPPASIINLANITGQTWLNWTWTNPGDVDFSHVLVYLNGTWMENVTEEWYNTTGLEPDTEYEIGTRTVDDTGNINGTWVNGTGRTAPLELSKVFDTGFGTYPSISGTHNGTIKLTQTITVNKLYTYSCPGTGGHTEYARIWNNTGLNATATWKGYVGDWHNISFYPSFTLIANETYNYTILTGSYPQIHHTPTLPTANGWINCTDFTDANGRVYDNWIPAIRLE
ncbi:hypothetical protein C5S30_06495 [ANME-1 cluster archaeon GoMg4]|nr:hypothetical protein [ANME-1 cluster archaeon GoMg4]